MQREEEYGEGGGGGEITYDILMDRRGYKRLTFSRMGETAVICGALQSNWLPFA